MPLAARPRTIQIDDDEPTLLQQWRGPKALALTGLIAIAFGYLFLPSGWFGGPRLQTVYPATGEATFEGKPLAGAIVTLHPLDPPSREFPSAKAVVDADGRFTLGTYAASDGAAAGEYRVSIVSYAPAKANEVRDESYRPRNTLPPRYANPQTSGLTATIGPGENRIEAYKLKRQ